MVRRTSIGITVDTHGHPAEDTARIASGARAAAIEQALETTAEVGRDHNGCRGRRGDRSAGRTSRWWAPWGSNPQPAD
jgi:hypothetical protein